MSLGSVRSIFGRTREGVNVKALAPLIEEAERITRDVPHMDVKALNYRAMAVCLAEMAEVFERHVGDIFPPALADVYRRVAELFRLAMLKSGPQFLRALICDD